MPIMDIGLAIARRQAIVDAAQKLMHPGVDFGRVSGTDRDVLLQPGADKLCNLFGLVIRYELTNRRKTGPESAMRERPSFSTKFGGALTGATS